MAGASAAPSFRSCYPSVMYPSFVCTSRDTFPLMSLNKILVQLQIRRYSVNEACRASTLDFVTVSHVSSAAKLCLGSCGIRTQPRLTIDGACNYLGNGSSDEYHYSRGCEHSHYIKRDHLLQRTTSTIRRQSITRKHLQNAYLQHHRCSLDSCGN